MTQANFRFSAEVLRRLGEELNPNPSQGLLELVKNAYDADATECTVSLEKIDRSGGLIKIVDNGDGLTLNQIRDGWLVLGRSGKDPRKTTRLGRIPSGSKGLGRLAALRLGARANLTTRPRDKKGQEFSLRINWEEFGEAEIVEEVSLDIKSRRSVRSGWVSGTEIEIEHLRWPINRAEVKRLARGLVMLSDPFSDDPKRFLPKLEAPEFADLEQLVANRYFTHADFHLHADLKSGKASARVTDWKDQPLFTASHKDLLRPRDGSSNGLYEAPDATFDLWAFLLTGQAFRMRNVSLKEVRTWLEHFGGVHVYRNGLRVAPYGNPGNDWLDLNLQRARNPEERPSTNTSIGRLTITDREEMLAEKTDRSGLIENQAFEELKRFSNDALEWMARRRLTMAETRRRNERRQSETRSHSTRKRVEERISKVKGPAREALESAFKSYDQSREREMKTLRSEVQLYRTLSTAGITAVTFAHEATGNPIKVIRQSIAAIRRRAQVAMGRNFEGQLERPISGIERAVKSLQVLASSTLRLVDNEKRRVGRVDAHRVISKTIETFEPFLQGRDVEVEERLKAGRSYFWGSEASLESIITNLLNNSLVAFEEGRHRLRKIEIRTQSEGEVFVIEVLDSGPGIQGVSLKDVWLPGVTTRANGTGLGLTIVRDSTVDLGGTVSAQAKGELGGATFRLEIPALPK